MGSRVLLITRAHDVTCGGSRAGARGHVPGGGEERRERGRERGALRTRAPERRSSPPLSPPPAVPPFPYLTTPRAEEQRPAPSGSEASRVAPARPPSVPHVSYHPPRTIAACATSVRTYRWTYGRWVAETE
eukprot:983261-Rhodomonas_salina.1